jgi:hypothetical protein
VWVGLANFAAMEKLWIILIAMILYAAGLQAQDQEQNDEQTKRRLTVVDVETLEPVVGANVVGKDMTLTTDSLGIVNVPKDSKSLAFSHVNYESRIINTKEVRDTVYLISKLLNLKEVIVWGKGKKRDYSELQKRLGLDRVEAQLMSGGKRSMDLIATFNKLFVPKKWRKSWRRKQRMKRLQEKLDDY